ncbi:unnamed protein product [Menidia menidia]|uniref:(Atlantic silverside) hypothetical protein n=1 Tax=Menidia menidia TaxID=238744 RepID=A0A8S4AZE9_9TELE|nr:unnamed protein product [Menidia menidia]
MAHETGRTEPVAVRGEPAVWVLPTQGVVHRWAQLALAGGGWTQQALAKWRRTTPWAELDVMYLYRPSQVLDRKACPAQIAKTTSSRKIAMYTFFASSTHRWGKVFRDTDTKLTLKSLSGTRWSAWAESTKALWKYYAQLSEALNDMSTDMEEKRETGSEASALCDKMDTLEMAFMAHF